MSLTVALIATLALTAPADGPRDAAGWRQQSDALYAQGDFQGALNAANEARALDQSDPWAQYAWLKALAAIDPEAARKALPGLQEPAALQALAPEDRARLHVAQGYLCLDLGVEPCAAMHFEAVPASTPSHPQSQAGLAILAVRRGHSRQALVHFVAARATGKLDAPLAELERETRFQVELLEFNTARNLRDANAAGRAYSVLDELRPHHPATLRARADLAELRGDAPARERALRDLLDVDRQSPGAAGQLVDTLLALNRPYDALIVARDLAPDRLAADRSLQTIERAWVGHVEVALGGRWREGQVAHDRLEMPQFQLALAGGHARWGRFRIAADALAPDSDRIPAGAAYGSSPALASVVNPHSELGVAALLQWAPWNGFVVELGHTPDSFEVANLTGALRFRVATADGPWDFGLEREVVGDSMLSFAGAIDPLTGLDWGGVTRNRAYVGASFGDEDLNLFGQVSGAIIDGHRVDENSQWEAEAGFWRRAASGSGWKARVGGHARATGYDDNRSQFTFGHGGYFSPRKYLAVGPAFDLSGQRDDRSFRFEGGLTWQVVREAASEYFPADALLQAASGDPRFPADSREGVGARLAATVEWRVSQRAVAGVRLEGVRGEDYDEVRLQVYTRRWSSAITEPLRVPPHAVLIPDSYELN
ncbi:MAG: cellulose synthase subunit BcsC-related outer membrane protein [Steroidobacteraceae bacterium]